MKIKKLLSFLFFTLLFVSSIFALTSCDFGFQLPHEHTWGEFSIVKEASCVEPGEKRHSCTLCKYLESEVIPATGHVWGEWGNLAEPTCTTDGEKRHDCQNCEHFETEAVSAIGHSYDGGLGKCQVCDKVSVGLAYTQVGEGYYVSGIGTCTDTDILIPAEYNSLPVTGIAENAFKNCTGLMSIFIPDGVVSIDGYAFFGCTALKSIAIGRSAATIGDYAFLDCSVLEKIYFNAVAMNDFSQYHDVFYNACKDGKGIEVVIGKSVTKIPAYLFSSFESDCPNKIIRVEFEEGSVCKSIGDYAFYQSFYLRSITIPDGVTSIGNYAFYRCNSLASITIPDSVISIGDSAFRESDGLEKITIPDGVTSIGIEAFRGCDRLRGVTFPDSVTVIGRNAFEECELNCNEYDNAYYLGNDNNPYLVLMKVKYKFLTSLSINENTKVIASQAFHDSMLKSINIPDSVTSICDGAFDHCRSLESVTIGDGVIYISDGAFSYCTGLRSVTIGNSITTIGSAFARCESLISVTIGSSVTSIGDSAFRSCRKLVEVINHSNLDIKVGDAGHGGVAQNALEVHQGPSKIDNQNGYLFYTCQGENYLLGYVGIEGAVMSLPKTYRTEKYAIYQFAFFPITYYPSVILPNSVTSIGYGAFYNDAYHLGATFEGVFYGGTEEEWNKIEISFDYDHDSNDNNYALVMATRYYYSETAPTAAGNYWHYDENGEIAVWK